MKTRLMTLLVTVAVASHAALFAQNTFSTLSGSIVDESGGVLPGVTVVAYNTTRGSRHEISTDRNGRFELIGLAQGAYTLEAGLPGFETYQQKLILTGDDVTREITLRVGSLEEMVTVTYDPAGAAPAPGQRVAPRPATCAPSTTTSTRIGGQIRTPRKIHHVAPTYPQGSAAGIVKIDAVIGVDGFVKETKVTNDAPDALARAAVDAVQQWEFDPTLLNCQAVDVRMAVTVDFR